MPAGAFFDRFQLMEEEAQLDLAHKRIELARKREELQRFAAGQPEQSTLEDATSTAEEKDWFVAYGLWLADRLDLLPGNVQEQHLETFPVENIRDDLLAGLRGNTNPTTLEATCHGIAYGLLMADRLDLLSHRQCEKVVKYLWTHPKGSPRDAMLKAAREQGLLST